MQVHALSDLRATYGPILKIVATTSSEPIWTTETLNESCEYYLPNDVCIITVCLVLHALKLLLFKTCYFSFGSPCNRYVLMATSTYKQ